MAGGDPAFGQHRDVELHVDDAFSFAGQCAHRASAVAEAKVISTAMPATQHPSRLKKFWRERVLGLIIAQLTQGVTPQKIALTIALGANLGVFPILGSTTLICGMVGFCLKL